MSLTVGKYEALGRKLLDVRSQEGLELNALCPYHSERNPSFRFNISTGLFFCHGCKQAGNADMLARHAGVAFTSPEGSITEVKQKLAALQAADAQACAQPGDAQYLTSAPPLSEVTLRRFNYNRDYWLGRGLTPQIIDTFDLGYDPLRAEAIIPLRNLEADLLGVIRRNVDWHDNSDGPKYRYPKGFTKSQHLYAAWLVAESPDTYCVLVEGSIDCMKLWQAGIQAMAIYGSWLSDTQVSLLHQLGIERVCLMFDNDKAGREATFGRYDRSGVYHPGAIKRLREFDTRRVVWRSFATGADPGGLSTRQIQALVGTSVRVLRK